MRRIIWIRSLLALVLVAVAASLGITRYLQTDSARRYLVSHLEASFGRPVEVRRFEFSLLDGARLEAHSLTVGEDPRFGNEYFLRADSLTAGLNWVALFSGRFEFGTLLLSQPSLNLVRDQQGRWNIEDWLPAASPKTYQQGFVGPRPAPSLVRLISIEFDGGRIDFKQGNEKTPFALLDVSGSVAQNAPGRWDLDLEAVPMRAGVTLQDGGTLRLRGTIGGTTARLQPANLNLTWREVSLADVLRLARQSDDGVRGELAVDLNARVEPVVAVPSEDAKLNGGRWAISGVARLTGIHRWDLPQRPADPALNLSVDASWRLGDRHAQIEKILVEMPKSHLQGSGELDWARGFRPEFHIESSSLGLGDVLNAYRAFRPGVPEDLTLDGILGLDATLAGWPLQLQQGAIASPGAKLAGSSLPSELRLGEINASVARGGLDFAPTEISFVDPTPKPQPPADAPAPPTINSFMVHGAMLPGNPGTKSWPPSWSFSITGESTRIQDWQTLAQTLAAPWGSGWVAAGEAAVNLTVTRRSDAPSAAWLGTMDTQSLTVSPVFLNQPLHFPKAHMDFTQSQRVLSLTATEAFGTTWRGTVSRKLPGGSWTFDVSADRLDAADLDRWLGPRARPGFFARITSLASADTNPAVVELRDAAAARVSAQGRVRIGQIVLAPLQIGQLDATVNLAGRNITVQKASAGFFGGTVKASFTAQLASDPVYQFDGTFDRVDLGMLAHALPTLRDRFSGIAAGTVELTAHGVGHDALMQSIQGTGTIDAKDTQLVGLNLSPVLSISTGDSSPARFAAMHGKFRFSRGGIELSNFVLEHPPAHLVADGHIDLSRALDIQIHPAAPTGKSLPEQPSPIAYSLGGTLEAPKWLSTAPPVTRSPKVGGFGK